MSPEELAACGWRKSAAELLGGTALEARLESAMNIEWWRGYHAHLAGHVRYTELLAAARQVIAESGPHLSPSNGAIERLTDAVAKCDGAS